MLQRLHHLTSAIALVFVLLNHFVTADATTDSSASAACCGGGDSALATSDSTYNSTTPVYGELPAVRSYFYVGGNYFNVNVNSTLYINQMYVEHLVPKNGSRQPYPIIFIHGQAQTGTNWLNKPDGTRGWASFFIDHGFEIYIIDQVLRGRSPWNPASGIPLSTYSAQVIEARFTAPEKFNLWPQAKLHTQWPGSGEMGDQYFDFFYESQVQFNANATVQETLMQAAGAALLDKVGPAVLFSHSQGGLMPWLWADIRPAAVKAIVSIEPTGPPFQDVLFSPNTSTRPYGLTDIPLTYVPKPTSLTMPLQTKVVPSNSSDLYDCIIQADPPRQLVNLANIPVLLEQSEASYHATYDYCTVMFLQQAGVPVEFLKLADIGIHGNGHVHFMENNSDQIAEVLLKWIKKTVGK